MVKEAEANASEDQAKKELVESKNQAEALIHSTDQNLKEHGEKISDEDKSAIQTALDELKKVKESDEVSEIKAKTETLAQATMKLGEAMYKAQEASQANSDQASDQSSDESKSSTDESEVVDADFEEVDEDKKD